MDTKYMLLSIIGWLFALSIIGLLLYILRYNKTLKKRLRHCESMYNSVMIASPDGIAITDTKGNIIKVSQSALDMFGYKEEEIKKFRVIDVVIKEDRDRALAELFKRLQGISTGEITYYQATHSDGSIFHLEVNTKNVIDSKKNTIGLVMVFRDITKRKQREEELVENNRKLSILSTTDGLTGVANRRYFEEVLLHEYSRHIRTEKELAIILADIDHFKAYNDHYGHLKGDECLRSVAKVFKEGVFRSYDLVARYGGEEFVLILPDTNTEKSLLVAERIRQGIMDLAIPHEKSKTAPIVTASFGLISSYCNIGSNAFDLVSEADKMLYRAKDSGRNQVVSGKKETVWEPDNIYFSPLKWQNSYLSGDTKVDEQHRAIFDRINDLLEIIKKPSLYEKIIDHAQNILNETATHFKFEESLMHSIGFPSVNTHAQEHEKLLKIAQYLIQQYKEKCIPANNLFLFFAHELVEQHVLHADCLFFPYISSRKP